MESWLGSEFPAHEPHTGNRRQPCRTIEMTINGVTKKIMIPVTRSEAGTLTRPGEGATSQPDNSFPTPINIAPISPEPINIEPIPEPITIAPMEFPRWPVKVEPEEDDCAIIDAPSGSGKHTVMDISDLTEPQSKADSDDDVIIIRGRGRPPNKDSRKQKQSVRSKQPFKPVKFHEFRGPDQETSYLPKTSSAEKTPLQIPQVSESPQVKTVPPPKSVQVPQTVLKLPSTGLQGLSPAGIQQDMQTILHTLSNKNLLHPSKRLVVELSKDSASADLQASMTNDMVILPTSEKDNVQTLRDPKLQEGHMKILMPSKNGYLAYNITMEDLVQKLGPSDPEPTKSVNVTPLYSSTSTTAMNPALSRPLVVSQQAFGQIQQPNFVPGAGSKLRMVSNTTPSVQASVPTNTLDSIRLQSHNIRLQQLAGQPQNLQPQAHMSPLTGNLVTQGQPITIQQPQGQPIRFQPPGQPIRFQPPGQPIRVQGQAPGQQISIQQPPGQTIRVQNPGQSIGIQQAPGQTMGFQRGLSTAPIKLQAVAMADGKIVLQQIPQTQGLMPQPAQLPTQIITHTLQGAPQAGHIQNIITQNPGGQIITQSAPGQPQASQQVIAQTSPQVPGVVTQQQTVIQQQTVVHQQTVLPNNASNTPQPGTNLPMQGTNVALSGAGTPKTPTGPNATHVGSVGAMQVMQTPDGKLVFQVPSNFSVSKPQQIAAKTPVVTSAPMINKTSPMTLQLTQTPSGLVLKPLPVSNEAKSSAPVLQGLNVKNPTGSVVPAFVPNILKKTVSGDKKADSSSADKIAINRLSSKKTSPKRTGRGKPRNTSSKVVAKFNEIRDKTKKEKQLESGDLTTVDAINSLLSSPTKGDPETVRDTKDSRVDNTPRPCSVRLERLDLQGLTSVNLQDWHDKLLVRAPPAKPRPPPAKPRPPADSQSDTSTDEYDDIFSPSATSTDDDEEDEDYFVGMRRKRTRRVLQRVNTRMKRLRAKYQYR